MRPEGSSASSRQGRARHALLTVLVAIVTFVLTVVVISLALEVLRSWR